jgi:hypothetical protein
MTSVLKFLFIIGLSVAQSLAGGFVLSRFWTWFINPKFTSAPLLNYLDCVGLMIIIGFFQAISAVSNVKVDEKKSDTSTGTTIIVKQLAVILVLYPLMLLSGFIWHQFIQ